jgi:hypothetical protein
MTKSDSSGASCNPVVVFLAATAFERPVLLPLIENMPSSSVADFCKSHNGVVLPAIDVCWSKMIN